MIAGLQWTEPVAIRQWEWQTQGLPESKKLFWLFAKWSLLLGISALFYVYRAEPTELPHIATAFFLMVMALPLQVFGEGWAAREECIRYSAHLKYTLTMSNDR